MAMRGSRIGFDATCAETMVRIHPSPTDAMKNVMSGRRSIDVRDAPISGSSNGPWPPGGIAGVVVIDHGGRSRRPGHRGRPTIGGRVYPEVGAGCESWVSPRR